MPWLLFKNKVKEILGIKNINVVTVLIPDENKRKDVDVG